ncbi:cytochrome c oxidase subunit 3 [Aequorivita vladivostokensis]|uniref:Cytochrome oxidase subunit III n=1 Tax=Aequorivita vladivostokensis TaxID=171194 RepID=A0ABR5DLY2_9FLAO|nr:cytochrome c oxidase subunit 3 [Aequorivita vladivostokensis]MAB56141.1 heme-copper oxidase subunit III [Aequorivita sp.]KJJ39786.1 cytochrome oxidase subunit III [Aequorivita vladivostokensis]MAO47529.1 heme-copper oxidase subunit III [Aequorivita sp.]MBF32218.1 heme-copper oxidase subunit III [Aequorivita sp.]HAV53679.1 heme-copper oxidase subunit III [Aequorivita sp.]|tara:strand:- start:92569 stop:93150 length:582 start_codon:yes stop_codon:yes gene_type:complete
MDLTQGSNELKIARAKKNMLWFGIISLTMSFAGLTSAYVVSKERPDWISSFEIPQAFYIALVLMIVSSFTYHFALRAIKKEQNKLGMSLLVSTLILGILFVVFQFVGFSEIIQNGYNFTGPTSSITTSFIYLVVLLHVAHVLAGLISIGVVIYNHYKQKYRNGKTLGVVLSVTFWHFVDIVWIYLFLFLYFVR